MRIEDQALDAAKKLIGPEAPYSKIGRERRVKLRRRITIYLLDFYERGRRDQRKEKDNG